ncbi:nucleotidyl transferase AbiEii/AbiGii toxin family protein [Actinopolymorpha alba]|uniref:nucleotidyl transferase AbiEii/AbiGii toxin family protein n=1 Tax=Actinopolymorpha alba TaxID=533267 RepID=UPI0003631700|nr:nucleotidyl transferase AbiEii/AbiGii toxin family protein [Actinopolymorpha alba]
MSPAPRKGAPAGDAFLAIQKLARSTGGDVQELLTLYALEGLLARLAASRYREDFVLKGGVLLAAFSLRRPTKDIDLQATRVANEIDDVLERIRELAAIDIDDGLEFNSSSITADTIREDGDYAGVRVRLTAALGRARLPIGIDVNFGDPIWPAPTPITLPRLTHLGQEPVQVLGYPLPMVIAEKTVTVLERAESNTRWRDFADLLTISARHEMTAVDLRTALETVAAYRRVSLRPLLPTLTAMPAMAQAKWSSWRRRHTHTHDLPVQLHDALIAIASFTDPVLGAMLTQDARWDPRRRIWDLKA